MNELNSLLTLQISCLIMLFLIAIFSGYLVFYLKKQMQVITDIGEQLAGGLFLSIGLFHLAGDAIQQLPTPNATAIVSTIIFLIVSGFFIIDFSLTHLTNRKLIPYSFAIMLFTHSLIEGAAIGIENNLQHILVLATAVLIHKGPETFAYALVLENAKIKANKAKLLIFTFALMSPIGLALALGISFSTTNTDISHYGAYVNAILAGAFIAFGLEALYEWSQSRSVQKARQGWTFLIGLVIMAGIIFMTET